MALSGSFNTSAYSNRYLTFSWTAKQDIAKNTSTISWTLKGAGGASGYYKAAPFTVVIDGETVYYSETRIDLYNGTTVASGTKTITHNSDGSRSFKVDMSAAIYYFDVNVWNNTTFTLDTIPRQAHITSATDFTDEENPTITYSNPAGSAVTSLQACIANETGGIVYVPYRDISKTGTSYTFVLTDAERENLRKAAVENTLSVRPYVKSVIGGQEYRHTPTNAKTMTIINANPVVTGSVLDSNEETIALTGDRSKLIKFFSHATATMSATPKKHASIDESLYIIRNGSNSGYGTAHTFEDVDSNTFTFQAEDSRGNVGTVTVSPPMIDYIKLTNYMVNNRPDATGHMTVACTGAYFNGSFGAVDNELTVQCRYGEAGGLSSDWIDMTVMKNGNGYYASAEITGLDYKLAYSFETRAIDKLSTVSSNDPVVKSMPIFHWGENDFVFEVPVTFNAGAEGADGEGDKTIKGNLRLKGDGNYGNYLYFGDGSYCFIAELTDDVMTLRATQINLSALAVTVNNSPIADHVIETGTEAMGSNGTWYWTKWDSGKAECYGVRNYGNMAIKTPFGDWYASEKFTQSFPSELFAAAPDYVDINVQKSSNGSGIVERGTSGLTAYTTNPFCLLYPVSATFQQVYFNFHAIGRWK